MDLIIFDFDGTLVDTRQSTANALNFALAKVGLEPRDTNFIWQHASNGALAMIKDVLGKSNLHLSNKVARFFFEYYREHPADNIKVIKGVRDLLEDLSCYKKIILSNRYKWLLDNILDKLDIRRYFLETYGIDSFPKSKPDPYPLLQIIKKHRSSRVEAIFVGDSINDIIASKNAGIKCIIIPSGATSTKEIKKFKPFKIVNDIREVKKWIR